MSDDTLDLERSILADHLSTTHTSPEEHRRLIDRLKLNAGSKLAAELVGRALQFLLAYQAQIALGPATYGQYTYAIAAGFVLAQLGDLGLQLIVTREVARDARRAASIVGTGLALKLILATGVSALLAMISLARPATFQTPVFALGLAMVANSFVEFIGYAFRGLQRVEHEAAILLLARVFVALPGIWAVRMGFGLTGLAVAYVIGAGLAAALGYLWLRGFFLKPILVFDGARGWSLLREALPLGGAILISIAYTRTAVFLLDLLRGPEATGLFGVAQKLAEPMSVIPAALMAAIFPAYIQASAREKENRPRGIRIEQAAWLRARSLRLTSILGAALASAGVLGSPWLIEQLYAGQYAGSAAILQILAIALLPTFVNYALTHFLIALGQQRLNLLFNAMIFVLNFALCLALIPRAGAIGAAAAVLISECVLFVLCGYALSRSTR